MNRREKVIYYLDYPALLKARAAEQEYEEDEKRRRNLEAYNKKCEEETYKREQKIIRVIERAMNKKTYSSDWIKSLRCSIRRRDQYTCQICGERETGLTTFDVHHIDYDKKNCDPSNLITVCRSCHIKTNGNRDYWIKYFRVKEV